MTKGGERAGAGRIEGSGKYGEKTKAIRVPISMLEEIQKIISKKLKSNLSDHEK